MNSKGSPQCSSHVESKREGSFSHSELESVLCSRTSGASNSPKEVPGALRSSIRLLRQFGMSTRSITDAAVLKEKRLVRVNATGTPIGEDSHLARYADSEIDMVFRLREEGLSYRKIARMMDMPPSTVWGVINGKFRAALFDHYKVRK